MTTFKIGDLMSKIKTIKANHTRNTLLYIDIHVSTLRDILLDPDLDSYMHYTRPPIITQLTIEELLGCKIFTHTDGDREIIKVTNRTEVILNE